MSNPVGIDDLVARWRPLTTEAEQDQAFALLDDAWAILQVQLPGLADRVDTGALDPALVRLVICQMVLRVLRNPEGIRQGSRTIDDFTESWTRDNVLSAGTLYALPEELALLRVPTAKRHARDARLVRTPPYGGREPYNLRSWDAW